MNGFLQLLGNWHFWAVALGYYLVMACIGGMPEPNSADSRRYRWLYRSAHIFAANVKSAFAPVVDKK
jgi:hypothetical protein